MATKIYTMAEIFGDKMPVIPATNIAKVTDAANSIGKKVEVPNIKSKQLDAAQLKTDSYYSEPSYTDNTPGIKKVAEAIPLRDDASESRVIGSILEEPALIINCENLKPRMFVNLQLGMLYNIIEELYNDNLIAKIDDLTIISKIETNEKYKKILSKDVAYNQKDCRQFLAMLRRTATNDVNEYVRTCTNIISSDFMRTAIKTFDKTAEKLKAGDFKGNVNSINLALQDTVMAMAENYLIEDTIEPMHSKIDKAWDEIVARRTEGASTGFPSKYPLINEFYTYEKGELVLVGGRKKSGKSMFFLNEAIHKLENGVPTAIFDTEMSTRQWMERYLAHSTGISVRDIKTGNYNAEQALLVEKAKDWLKAQPFDHIYQAEWTQDMIYTMAKSLQRKMGLEFLIYDYIKATSTTRLEIQEHNYLGDMTNFLKNNVAGKMDIAVLAGGQMSPKETRMADSDKISRYASVITYWIRKGIDEVKPNKGNYKFFIADNRLGRQFEEDEYIDMKFNGDIALIQQAGKEVERCNPLD